MDDPLQRWIQVLEDDVMLLQPDQLHRRLHVLDRLDACFADAHEELLTRDTRSALYAHARELSQKLEEINETLYAAIRAAIVRGEGAETLLRWMPAGIAVDDGSKPVRGMGYDSLDELIRGVLAFEEPGAPPASIDPEMVFYQPTPARHIVHMLRLTDLTPDDVLVDLGSGLGHVPLLVAVCTPARGVGIELEPSYVACAWRCAEQLRLSRASFVHEDARTADLSAGTVFYLHTPFTGSIMRLVLDRLRAEAEVRPVRICTYGPCTAVVAAEQWLQVTTSAEVDRIAVFTSEG